MNKDNILTKQEIIHVIAGGGICLTVMITLFGVMGMALEQMLVNFGILGVIIFDSFTIARIAITFALVYLVSGFLAGLYMGYFTEKGLKVTLPITGIIGSIGFVVLLFFSSGGFNVSKLYLERIVFPCLGSIIGTYLGGYTLRRPSEETYEKEEITLELEE